jgi:outer membrane protein assembly factor BamB
VRTPVKTPLSIRGNYICFGTYNDTYEGAVYFLNTKNGSKVWRKEVGSSIELQTPIGSQYAYIGSSDPNNDNQVTALNIESGKVQWTMNTEGGVSTLSLYNGKLIVGIGFLRESTINILDTHTGSVLWSKRINASGLNEYSVSNNNISILSLDPSAEWKRKAIYKIDLTDLKVSDMYKFNYDNISSPNITKNSVIVSNGKSLVSVY